MLYAHIAFLLAAFGAGFLAGFNIQADRIDVLETSRDTANGMAEQQLLTATAKAHVSEESARIFNQQLDASHAQNLATVNTLVDRVRSARHQDCSNAMPKSTSAGVVENEATDHSGFEQFARLAGQSAAYAETCWQFVNNNCGIADGGN